VDIVQAGGFAAQLALKMNVVVVVVMVMTNLFAKRITQPFFIQYLVYDAFIYERL
jgi:hypothetical protein